MFWGDKVCTNYFVLDPEKASFLDLFRILFSSEVEKRTFIDLPESEKLIGLQRRWLIFISVLAQKIFIRLKWPMAQAGLLLEFWLNLPTSNGGYGRLLLNILLGKFA